MYGLCDSEDYWNATMDEHITEYLKTERAVSDVPLYFCFEEGKIAGITENYVDDNTNLGSDDFQQESLLTLQKLNQSHDLTITSFFFGAQISKICLRVFEIMQPHYISALHTLPAKKNINAFQTSCATFARILHSLPEFSYIVNKSDQTTKITLSEKHITDLNKAIQSAKNEPMLSLTFKPLDVYALHLQTYADASYASHNDFPSQIRYIVILCDNSNACNILDYSSRKSRRVVCLITRAELYALTDVFDFVTVISADSTQIFGKLISVCIFTNSKQAFDIITRGKKPTKKRLALDVMAAREVYQRFDVERVGLIRGKNNSADAFTKLCNNRMLERFWVFGTDNTVVEEWIVWKTPKEVTDQKKMGHEITTSEHLSIEKSGECERLQS